MIYWGKGTKKITNKRKYVIDFIIIYQFLILSLVDVYVNGANGHRLPMPFAPLPRPLGYYNSNDRLRHSGDHRH